MSRCMAKSYKGRSLKSLANEKTEELECLILDALQQMLIMDLDDTMARAVDIGEDDDGGEDSDVEVEEEAGEKITCNWSVLKSTPELQKSKSSFLGSFPAGILQVRFHLNNSQRALLLPCIKCEKEDESFKEVSVERPPYYSYMDSTFGQLEPASGARASIPGEEYWPEGTASRVRAARASEPTGNSLGSPSFGKNPGSRRKYKTSVAAPESSNVSLESSDPLESESSVDTTEEPNAFSSDYVVYETEPEQEETGYGLDKKSLY